MMKEEKKSKMAARNDFHWLRFLPISVYHICQSVSFALRRSLSHHLQSQFIAKDLQSLVLSLLLALFPILDCDLRCPLFQSSDIQTHWE